MEMDGTPWRLYGSTFQMIGAAQRKAWASMQVRDGYFPRRQSSSDDLRILNVILDHRYTGSLDSSSLYVIVATLYFIRLFADSQWSSFSLLDTLMLPRRQVTARASVFWICWGFASSFHWYPLQSHWHSWFSILWVNRVFTWTAHSECWTDVSQG